MAQKINKKQASGAVELFYAEGADLAKATRAYAEVASLVVTPTISGKMRVDYRCDFGFDTSARTSNFRIKVNGTIVSTTTQGIYAVAAQWGTAALFSNLVDVVAGTSYTISIEANHTSCYVQRQPIGVIVQGT